MGHKREIRDPVHGFIERSREEEKIIDTVCFQRLRGIKQLAMAHLVYPGAMHTRFDHSIGVMHVAGRLAQKLVDDQERRDTIRLAALLHDIGHGPFSHVSEEVLSKYAIAESGGDGIHEQISRVIIENDKGLSDILGRDEIKNIVGLHAGTSGEAIDQEIISGALDADKQDYLLRDSYFCGVKYGVFDLERLIGTLEPHWDPADNAHVMAASRDGVHAIEQFVLAKYYMSTQVYGHS